jgi:hypothetical protein
LDLRDNLAEVDAIGGGADPLAHFEWAGFVA